MPHDAAFHLALHCLPKNTLRSERVKRQQQLSLCRDEFIEHIPGNRYIGDVFSPYSGPWAILGYDRRHIMPKDSRDMSFVALSVNS